MFQIFPYVLSLSWTYVTSDISLREPSTKLASTSEAREERNSRKLHIAFKLRSSYAAEASRTKNLKILKQISFPTNKEIYQNNKLITNYAKSS